MTTSTQSRGAARWSRFVAGMTAFAEASEMDATGYMAERMAWLERRIAVLEDPAAPANRSIDHVKRA